jgi:hypothetical protein
VGAHAQQTSGGLGEKPADPPHARGYVATLTPFAATLFLCVTLTACAAALLPAVVAPQVAATVAVAGLSAASCAGNSSCEQAARQCASQTDKKIEVTEAADIDIPADEGKIAAFTPAYWQPQFETEIPAKGAPAVEATAGTFAVTDKSIVFVPAPGTPGVHLPLVGVLNIELQQNSATGAPRQLTVESCFGRLDRFTFGQTQNARQLDSKATADAAAEIKARIATARPPVRN